MTIDPSKLDAFVGRFVHDVGAVFHATTVLIGDRLGLYVAMAEGSTITRRPSPRPESRPTKPASLIAPGSKRPVRPTSAATATTWSRASTACTTWVTPSGPPPTFGLAQPERDVAHRGAVRPRSPRRQSQSGRTDLLLGLDHHLHAGFSVAAGRSRARRASRRVETARRRDRGRIHPIPSGRRNAVQPRARGPTVALTGVVTCRPLPTPNGSCLGARRRCNSPGNRKVPPGPCRVCSARRCHSASLVRSSDDTRSERPWLQGNCWPIPQIVVVSPVGTVSTYCGSGLAKFTKTGLSAATFATVATAARRSVRTVRTS